MLKMTTLRYQEETKFCATFIWGGGGREGRMKTNGC